MLLKSFSKINLSLNINKKLKRNSRLHDIQSYFCLIDLYDQMNVKKINGQRDIVKFNGKFAKDINKANNTIIDSLKILSNSFQKV